VAKDRPSGRQAQAGSVSDWNVGPAAAPRCRCYQRSLFPLFSETLDKASEKKTFFFSFYRLENAACEACSPVASVPLSAPAPQFHPR
jgi:hypothetical protein